MVLHIVFKILLYYIQGTECPLHIEILTGDESVLSLTIRKSQLIGETISFTQNLSDRLKFKVDDPKLKVSNFNGITSLSPLTIDECCGCTHCTAEQASA